MSETIWSGQAADVTSSAVDIPAYSIGIFSIGVPADGALNGNGANFNSGSVLVKVSSDGGTNYGVANILTDSDMVELRARGKALKVKLDLVGGSGAAELDAFYDIVPACGGN